MTEALRSAEGADGASAGSMIKRAINDGTIDPSDARSIDYWADHFRLDAAELLPLAEANGWSAHLVEKALGLARMRGPVRRSLDLE
jgi:hypothetical protein